MDKGQNPSSYPLAFTTYLSGDFDDLAGTDASGASVNGLMCAIHKRPHPAQIGVPAAPGDVVGVADVVSIAGAFPTQIACTSHLITSSREENSSRPAILADLQVFAHWSNNDSATMN